MVFALAGDSTITRLRPPDGGGEVPAPATGARTAFFRGGLPSLTAVDVVFLDAPRAAGFFGATVFGSGFLRGGTGTPIGECSDLRLRFRLECLLKPEARAKELFIVPLNVMLYERVLSLQSLHHAV
jgi:hypothetical protein